MSKFVITHLYCSLLLYVIIDESKYTGAVFLDLVKAFDSVNHEILHYVCPKDPLIFALYIDDLPIVIKHSLLDLYADGAELHCY